MVKTKDPNIATEDRNAEMEEAPKSGNTLGIEEAKEPTAAVRKTPKTLMETELGRKSSKGIMVTETGEDKETIEAMRPADHNHPKHCPQPQQEGRESRRPEGQGSGLTRLQPHRHPQGQRRWGQQHPSVS